MDQTNDVERRLAALARRLSRIERELGIEPTEVPRAAQPGEDTVQTGRPPVPLPRPQPRFPQTPPPLPPRQPAHEAGAGPVMPLPVEPVLPAEPVSAAQEPPAVRPPKILRPEIPLAYEPALAAEAPRQTIGRSSLEHIIGLKWTGWVGAVVLLVGVSLGVRFAYEQGWLRGLPDSVRLALIALGGAGLIGLGEWAYRRVNVFPAASLFGAGIATLFVASYAGYAYYRLYDPGAAFALMALSTLVGATVARRGNLVSIGVLSILGGNVTPVVIHTPHPHLGGFLAYLAMLEAVALLLVYFGRTGKWQVLRGLSLATTAFWMTQIVGTNVFGPPPAAWSLTASILFALGYQAEVLASSRRGPDERDLWPDSSAVFSLLTTAALTVGGLWVLPTGQLGQRVTFVAAEAIACAAGAVALRPMKALSQSLATQSAALLAVLVPVWLSGAWVILGWGVLAIAMALMGRGQGMGVARVMAIGVWILAIGDLLGRLANGDVHDPVGIRLLSVHGTALRTGLILAWGLALAGDAVAWLTTWPRREEHPAWQKAASSVSAAAAGLWLIVSADQLPALGATVSLVALAWLAAGAGFFTSRLSFSVQAMALLLVASVKWAALDAITQRLSPSWSAMGQHPLVNTLMGTALLLAVSLVAIGWLHRRTILAALQANTRWDQRQFLFALACCVIGLLSVAFSMQIDLVIQFAVSQGRPLPWPAGQMEQLAFTMLWSAAVAAAWAADRLLRGERERPRLGFALSLAFVLAAKYAAIDCLAWSGEPRSAMLGFNLSVFAAVVVAALLLLVTMVRLRPAAVSWPTPGALAAAIFVVFWAGTFEIGHAVTHRIITNWAAWPWPQLMATLLTAWWALAAAAALVLAEKMQTVHPTAQRLRAAGAMVLVLLAVIYLTVDTLMFRVLTHPPAAAVLLDPQALAAAVLMCGLGLVWRRRAGHGGKLAPVAGFLMMLVMLWIGSLEIDRFFAAGWRTTWFADPQLAEQVAISIFWSIFAAAAVGMGFKMRASAMRYFGLGLFAVTLAKVVLIDMEQVSTGYRVLSFLGLGALLLGTSVLYGKLSPKLS